jgi:enoyl-CoA hydratase/carnithine racemase
MSDGLIISTEGNVGTIVMNRPPHNFLNYDQIGNIAAACEAMDVDPEIRAIVLAAEGRSFCAGANFASGGVAPDIAGGEREDIGGNSTQRLYAEGLRLFKIHTPIVAAVQGPAVGGGLGLAVAADFRVTCPEARFSANFAALGIHQGFGLSVTLPELLGRQMASRVLLTAHRYKGDEAVAIGLADELATLDTVRACATELAEEIAANAPLALRSIRSTLRDGLADRVAAATDHEAGEQATLSRTNDAREGIAAVGERRPGNFTAS